ncbi:hypothetical protein LXL04_015592 [Taraxacum kok-saghyz]
MGALKSGVQSLGLELGLPARKNPPRVLQPGVELLTFTHMRHINPGASSQLRWGYPNETSVVHSGCLKEVHGRPEAWTRRVMAIFQFIAITDMHVNFDCLRTFGMLRIVCPDA